MKIKIPELEITAEEGFAQNDKFSHKGFGDKLSKLFQNADQSIVVALEGEWGCGKSTFLKMWQGHVKSESDLKLDALYINSHLFDSQKNAFACIASGLYNELQVNAGGRSELLGAMSKLGKTTLLKASAALINHATFNIIDLETLKEAKDSIEVSGNGHIEEEIKQIYNLQEAIHEFKDLLKRIITSQKNKKQFVIIVDELDRCRPDFALSILESVKHFFDVPGLSFLIAVNRRQLETSIRHHYGSDIKPDKYLSKYITVSTSLPTSDSRRGSPHSSGHFSYTLNALGIVHSNGVIQVLRELVEGLSPSLREAERIASKYAIILMTEIDIPEKPKTEAYEIACSLGIYISQCHPTLFQRILEDDPLLTNHHIYNEIHFDKMNRLDGAYYIIGIREWVDYLYSEENPTDEMKKKLSSRQGFSIPFSRDRGRFQRVFEAISILNV